MWRTYSQPRRPASGRSTTGGRHAIVRTGSHPQRRPRGPRRRRARPRWPRPCWSRPGPSPGPGGSRTAPPRATSSPRSSAGASRSAWPWPRSSGRATRSTCSTPPAPPTSSARRRWRCGWPTWPCSWSARSTACSPAPAACGGEAAALGIPRMVFVNKLDRDRSSFDAHPRRAPGGARRRHRPARAPDRRARARSTASPTCCRRPPTSTTAASAPAGPIPDEMLDAEHEIHDNLVEGIVVGDDEQLERYLAGDMPSVEELEHTLARGVDDATVFPVVCGSATERIGIDRLADFICEIGPSPLDRPGVEVAGRRHHRRRSTPTRRARPLRAGLPHHRRPVRRPGRPVQGAVGHGAPRRPPGEPPHRHRRAPARPVHPARQGARRGGRRRPPATSPRSPS